MKSFSDSSFTNSIGNYYSLGNKEFIIINKNSQTNLINQYYFCVYFKTQTHCISKIVVKSETDSNDYLSEGETEINSINFKENSKKFIVVKQNISNPYFIFIKELQIKHFVSQSKSFRQFFDVETSAQNDLMIVLDSLD